MTTSDLNTTILNAFNLMPNLHISFDVDTAEGIFNCWVQEHHPFDRTGHGAGPTLDAALEAAIRDLSLVPPTTYPPPNREPPTEPDDLTGVEMGQQDFVDTTCQHLLEELAGRHLTWDPLFIAYIRDAAETVLCKHLKLMHPFNFYPYSETPLSNMFDPPTGDQCSPSPEQAPSPTSPPDPATAPPSPGN